MNERDEFGSEIQARAQEASSTPENVAPGSASDLEPSDASTAAVTAPTAEPIVSESAGTVVSPEVLPETGWMGSLQSLLVTVVIAVFVITFIVQAFQIPSESMEDTLLIGDYLLVDKAHFGPGGIWGPILPYSRVHRGDIVVFRFPIHPSQHFVKRVIGVPGDHIRLFRKHVFVNGTEMQEPFVNYRSNGFEGYRDNFPNGQTLTSSVDARWYLQMRKLVENGQLIVPEDSYFVLGDNRDESLDSRYWGFVPRENIIGRPLVIYFSVRTPNSDDGYESSMEVPSGGKLTRFGQALVRVLADIRWKRMFRLVR